MSNFSYVYVTTGTIPHRTIKSYVSLCPTITKGARSRCRGLLTTFTTLFGPTGPCPLFFASSATYPRYLQHTQLISTAAALNTSSNYTHCGPFSITTKPTHAPPIASFLILTNRIISYYNQSRHMTSLSHNNTQTKSTITSSLQDGGVLTTSRSILPTLRNKIYLSPRRHPLTTQVFPSHISYALFQKSFISKIFRPFSGAPGAPEPIFVFPSSRYISPYFFRHFDRNSNFLLHYIEHPDDY